MYAQWNIHMEHIIYETPQHSTMVFLHNIVSSVYIFREKHYRVLKVQVDTSISENIHMSQIIAT